VATLAAIRELRRLPAPGPEPLGLAFSETMLWITSREAHRLYAVDPATWSVREEVRTPGAPFGVAVGRNELWLVIGFGEDDDDRYLCRFVPGEGFDADRVACPDLSGVHVAVDDDTLYLSQAHNKKLLTLDERGAVTREIQLARRPVGMTIVRGQFYFVTTDDNFGNYEITELDARADTPRATAFASIPFRARDLAFDGSQWWTADRTANEIVACSVESTA
jgi:hypothetical protein